MSDNKRKISVYLPIFFALILMLGIYIGLRLNGVSDYQRDPFHPPADNKLNNILDYISQDYVDSIDREELLEESITEILNQLDPHSQYISREDFDLVNDPLQGNFEGIGIEFRIVKDTITVIHAIPGGPSEKVGLRGGDRIVTINDSLVAGTELSSRDAMKLLKGKRGTEVDVGVFRRGLSDLIDFTIIRGVIPTYSLDAAYMINDSTGYIKLNKFSSTTYEEFITALTELEQKGMQDLVLDLRGNVGGYLKAAIDIADEFLPEDELIVYTKGNHRPKNVAYATTQGDFENGNLVILIDEGSASASEVLAGAIQDNDRGTIVGRRSFGKGLVQEQLNFKDGSAIRLTVARYYTPTGRSIQKPYHQGKDDYYKEYYERFINGEMQHPDSIRFNDSLKYITKGGKVVFGGGGIMPDVYVPLDYDDNEFYTSLLARGLIYQFAFNYTDKIRQDLIQYDSYTHFKNTFSISDELFHQFIDYVEEKGVELNTQEVNDAEARIKTLLKAYIAQNLYNDAGFYPIYHKVDDAIQKALDILAEN